MFKYLIAAIIGFFSCPIACLMNGVYYYEWTWVDFFLAGFYALIIWCWCGKNGVYRQLKDYFTRRKNNVHR